MAGHISRRKRDGGTVWRARYPDPTRGGTAQIERVFQTRREAERWLNEQRVAVQRGTHIDPAQSQRRVRDVVEVWRETWVDLEPKTKAGYESILTRHILDRWGDARIGAVSAEAVQKWVNELARSGRAPGTVAHIYGVLRSLMKLAVERQYIAISPCGAVRLPRRRSFANGGDEKEMLFLTAEEVAAVAGAINPHYRVMVYTAAYTGLRAGELGGLRRRDIDLLHRRLHVQRALKDVNTSSANIAAEDKGLIFGPTKNGRPRRLGIPKFLSDMLTAHLEGIEGGSDALVFTSSRGGPMRHGNFYRRHFKPAVRAALPAEKEGLRFHDLRHTCAALLIAAGAHPKAIQEHLGHRDIQTTFNVYGHLLPSAQEALTAALDAAYVDEARARRKAAGG